MTESKHVNGPWRYSAMMRPPIGKYDGDLDANGNVFWGYSISGCDEHGAPILPTIASVHNFPDQVEANARLIAAAPELLEALKWLAEDYTAVCHDRQSKYKSPNGICALDNALAALSKASPTQTEEGRRDGVSSEGFRQ